MTSEKQVQKFHTDDASPPRSGQGFWLVVPCVKFDSLNKSEVIPDRQHNTLQVWFTNNDRENAQIEIRYENEKIPGSLRNDDGDGNENDKKATGLDNENNNFARASRLFVHFSAVVARLPRETAQVHVLSRTGTKAFPFSFSELWCSPWEFNSKKLCQHLNT